MRERTSHGVRQGWIMIPTPHPVRALAVVLLVGFALPAAAWPISHVADEHLNPPPVLVVDCNASVKNACYLRMNSCLYQNSRRCTEIPGARGRLFRLHLPFQVSTRTGLVNAAGDGGTPCAALLFLH